MFNQLDHFAGQRPVRLVIGPKRLHQSRYEHLARHRIVRCQLVGAAQIGQRLGLLSVMKQQFGSMQQGPMVVGALLEPLLHELPECLDLIVATELVGVVRNNLIAVGDQVSERSIGGRFLHHFAGADIDLEQFVVGGRKIVEGPREESAPRRPRRSQRQVVFPGRLAVRQTNASANVFADDENHAVVNAAHKEQFFSQERRPLALAGEQIEAVELIRIDRREHDAAVGDDGGAVEPAVGRRLLSDMTVPADKPAGIVLVAP